MQDGNTMRNNYGCDLDSLTTGSRIGMMRTAKGDLHYFINGVDQGVACSGLPPGKGETHGTCVCTCGVSFDWHSSWIRTSLLFIVQHPTYKQQCAGEK